MYVQYISPVEIQCKICKNFKWLHVLQVTPPEKNFLSHVYQPCKESMKAENYFSVIYGNFICQKAKMTFQCFTEKHPCYTHMQVRPYFSQLLQKLPFIILSHKITIDSVEK